MEDVSFVISDTPPSLNRVGGSGGWRVFARHKKRWQSEAELWLMVLQIPRPLEFVEASVVLRFPTRRRRDVGNYQALLDKSIGDALVNGQWLLDDTSDYYRFASLSFDPAPGASKTTVRIRYRA